MLVPKAYFDNLIDQESKSAQHSEVGELHRNIPAKSLGEKKEQKELKKQKYQVKIEKKQKNSIG